MNKKQRPVIFGEVLFDCFPDGQQVLGGAPFNVAWHLQAFGDRPCFISRVGDDAAGQQVKTAMQNWQMDTHWLQTDLQYPTGHVEVTLKNNEPQYSITTDVAYDFIHAEAAPLPADAGLIYHGTLALRSATTRQSFEKLAATRYGDDPTAKQTLPVFLDVNLRAPWWQMTEVNRWLKQAHWVKLNSDELAVLGANTGHIEQDMARFQRRFDLELLIVTRGEQGAVIRSRDGQLHQVEPAAVTAFVDTVGAGDAFTSVLIHGLLAGWPLTDMLEAAQQFASAVIGLRGAISRDAEFYQQFKF